MEKWALKTRKTLDVSDPISLYQAAPQEAVSHTHSCIHKTTG